MASIINPVLFKKIKRIKREKRRRMGGGE